MRGNKRTFPNFHFAFMISMNSNSFQIQNPREKMTWLLPFKMKRVFENIWISFGNISNSETLRTSMIFMREDKMTSSKTYEIWVGSFKETKFNAPLKSSSIWSYFGFYSNYFSPKIKYMENRVKWFHRSENWREINLKSFCKMIFMRFYCNSCTLCFI